MASKGASALSLGRFLPIKGQPGNHLAIHDAPFGFGSRGALGFPEFNADVRNCHWDECGDVQPSELFSPAFQLPIGSRSRLVARPLP
jgi:hypothetical protein